MITKEILTRGYFPRELPPSFNSLQLEKIDNSASYSQIRTVNQSSFLLPVSVPRIKYSRRELNIPNPLAMIKLALEIEDNFSQIYRQINKSTISKSLPIYSNKGRAFKPKYWHNNLVDFRADIYSKSRYILNTDIQKFYPNIYTHSIPWALHTKTTAKTQRTNNKLLGNKLDKLVRSGQDNQTVGVPIGPDTSLFIAEVLLSSVDEELAQTFPNLIGFRFVDDYCFGFKNYREMESLLSHLQILLRDLELKINFEKTDLQQTPMALQDEWVHKIKDIDFRSSDRGFKNDLVHLVDTMIYSAKEFPDNPIFKFGLSILGNQNCSLYNWTLYQSLLNEIMKGEPNTIPQIFNNYLKYFNNDYRINFSHLSDTLCEIIEWQFTMGNYYEIAYCLWFFIYFNIQIPSRIANILGEIENSLVALISLDAESKHLVTNLDKSIWQQIIDNREELYGKNWLLAYEAVKKNWIIPSSTNHVINDQFFSILHNNDVEFYSSDNLIGRLKPILTSGSNPSSPQISLLPI